MMRKTDTKNDSYENGKPFNWQTIGTFCVVIIMIITLTITFWDRIAPGEVRPLQPSGFSVIRGIGAFDSDHIVFPIDWENTGGKSVLIMHPTLVLRKLDHNGYETKNETIFYMAGEYPEISNKAFAEPYSIKESFILAPRTITQTVIVFHIEKWWNYTDETSENFSFFSLKKDENYSVYINFNRELEPMPGVMLIKYIDIPDYVDNLRYDRSWDYWWEWFRIENQTVY